MKPELLTLILNIVFFGIIALAFLFGLKGVKKATSSLFSFLIAMVVVIFLASPVTNWVLGWQFGGKTVENIILGAINSMFGESLATNEMLQNLVKGLPATIVCVVVCIVLILLLGLLFKIIGNIIYKAIFGKKEKKVVEEVQIVNNVPQMTKKTQKENKHRLLGGLVGMVHGFLLIFVMFMPVIGLVNIVNDIAGVNEVSAQEYVVEQSGVVVAGEGSFELKPSKELLKQYLPEQFFDYAKALDNSILAKVGKIGNMSDFSLNLVARFEINGQTIKLGQEIRTLVGVYDEFVDFATQASQTLGTTDLNAILNDIVENPNSYDFDKLYSICDHLFSSNLVKAMSNEALLQIANALVSQNQDSSLQPLFIRLQTAVKNYCACGYNLKDDAKALLGAFEVSAKSGLIKAVATEPFEIENVTNILLNEQSETRIQDEVLTQLSGKITSSNLLQKFVIEATNYGCSYVQDVMNQKVQFNNDEKLVLPLIDSKKAITVTSTELTKVISGAFKVYSDVVKVIDFDALSADLLSIFDYDLKNMVQLVGNELDIIVNMQLFKESNIVANICDAMSNSEYSKYLSFNELAKTTNLKQQFNLVSESLDQIKNSSIVSTLKNLNEVNKNESYDAIIDALATKDTNNKTLANNILSPILSCPIFKNTIVYGLDSAKTVIQQALTNLSSGTEVTISNLNTDGLTQEALKTEIVSLVDNVINYAKDIQISSLTTDKLMDTLLASDLGLLGTVLDSIKASPIFAKTSSTGAYVDIISALQNSTLNSVLNFENATLSTFSWQSELSALKTVVDDLNSILVNTSEGDKGLVTFLLDGGDFDTAYSSLTAENSKKIKPVFEISLIKPLAVNIVNTINGYIKEFVGPEIGTNIVDIDKSVDLSAQAEQITNVISSAIEVDFNETDLDKVDKEKINNLLDALQVNAQADGVFKEAYNALLVKVANMINENILSFVGNTAGSQIELLNTYVNILPSANNIRNILNTAFDTVKTLKDASFEKLNTTTLYSLIGVLRDNSTICNGVFAKSYNALSVYIINTVNDKIKDYINDDGLTSEIVTYDGTEPIGDKYNYVKEIIECAVTAFDSVGEGSLEDIDSTILSNLLDALDSLSYTRKSFNALNNKLANEVIKTINSTTGATVALITSVQDLSSQAEDVKSVLNASLEVSNITSYAKDSMSEEDKIKLVTLLNAMQTNALKTNGVFTDAYDAIVNYVATQNGTTKEVIYNNFTTDGKIDWSLFINS